MRQLRTAAAFTAIVLSPAIVGAASWQPATATAVRAGVSSNSTFVIAAYVTLPSECNVARIRMLSITSQLHRTFVVEQMPGPSMCPEKPIYRCAVVSQRFRLPVPREFEVESKGKTWPVTLAKEAPNLVPPICPKP
jgi:hypothetical protein